jgi:hypothetical protein
MMCILQLVSISSQMVIRTPLPLQPIYIEFFASEASGDLTDEEKHLAYLLTVYFLYKSESAFKLSSYESIIRAIRTREVEEGTDIYTPMKKIDFTEGTITLDEIIDKIMEKDIIRGFTTEPFISNKYKIISY